MRAYQIRYALLALVISAVLWGMTHGASKIDQGFDIPVVFEGVPEDLVITAKSTQLINIRVLGPRSALREVSPIEMEYGVNLEGAKPGKAVYLVDETTIELPPGARILSRSPATIELELERRARKSVRVAADVEGEPAEGFVLSEVELDPPRVWLAGARSEVLRLSEVVTETIDVTGLVEPFEREVRVSLGASHVWVDEDQPVRVRIQIDPVPDLELTEEPENG
jgi:YbbR domain-containing protein